MFNLQIIYEPQALESKIPSSSYKKASNPNLSPEIVARTDFGAPKNNGPTAIHVWIRRDIQDLP